MYEGVCGRGNQGSFLFPHLFAAFLEGDLFMMFVDSLHILFRVHKSTFQGLFFANLGLCTHGLLLDGLFGLFTKNM